MVYVSISAPKSPTPGTAAEIVFKHGIRALDGVPLLHGDRVVYVHRNCIERDSELYADDPGQAWRCRVYGGTTPDADMVNWIYLNTVRPANT